MPPQPICPLRAATGAQFLALGGMASAAITAVGGLAGEPWLIGVAGVVMLAANLAALHAERRRR